MKSPRCGRWLLEEIKNKKELRTELRPFYANGSELLSSGSTMNLVSIPLQGKSGTFTLRVL